MDMFREIVYTIALRFLSFGEGSGMSQKERVSCHFSPRSNYTLTQMISPMTIIHRILINGLRCSFQKIYNMGVIFVMMTLRSPIFYWLNILLYYILVSLTYFQCDARSLVAIK
jgi:hypothetical protein